MQKVLSKIASGLLRRTPARKEPRRAWNQTRVAKEIDADTQLFIDDNRRRWKFREAGPETPVVLISHYFNHPIVYNFTYLSHYLADKFGAVPRGYCFDQYLQNYTEEIYQSFGAPLDLSFEQGKAFEEEAIRRGERIFAGLRTKRDLVALSIEGVQVGDLIYNWYCRRDFRHTIDLEDPFLFELIVQAHIIHTACVAYLDTHRVAAILPNHSFYPNSGILMRLALVRGIPAYQVDWELVVTRFPEYRNEDGKPMNSKRVGPYYRYREIFESLPADVQAAGVAKSREILNKRLQGGIDQKVLVHTSAWGSNSETRILQPTDVSKILVMAHDFCDNIHKFRRMIFPDFYEWLNFLLTHAQDTPYEWYVKPHPNLLLEEKNILNRRILGELKERFPKIHFLGSGISNLQLIAEGAACAFTVHGTAGHEFAYMGLPVVNAGDNLHASFDFNYHAKTEEEFLGYIKEAGRLKVPGNKEQVEQFCYMHFCEMLTLFHGTMQNPAGDFLKAKEVRDLAASTAVLRYYVEHTPENWPAIVKEHLDQHFVAELDLLGRYVAPCRSNGNSPS